MVSSAAQFLADRNLSLLSSSTHIADKTAASTKAGQGTQTVDWNKRRQVAIAKVPQ